MKSKLVLALLVTGLTSGPVPADVPFTFQSGTPAQASQVNQNFQNLDTRMNKTLGGVIQRVVEVYNDTGVAAAICPADSAVFSATCDCDSIGGTKNFGVLFACKVAGNGGVAGCFPEGVTYRSYLPNPRAAIKLVCLAGRANDGSVLVWTPIYGSGAGAGGAQKTQKELSDDLESATKALQDSLADHEATLKSTK